MQRRALASIVLPLALAAIPEAAADPLRDARVAELATVDRWFYFLAADLTPTLIEQVAGSSYDLVVIDFIPSERWNTDFPIADVVAGWQTAPHRKLVLAYVDIGQAESYRTYWQPGWRVGHPDWIVAEDPDGWAENYPVAYWHPAWRAIWLAADDGLLAAIVDAGFDGIYLDWIEAYSDDRVMAAAATQGIDTWDEMTAWVGDLADAARARDPGFLIVAQNALELVEDPDYRLIIDGVAQEQIWFDGGADNNPPGDCPLPRTDADIGTVTYRASLSPACLRQHDAYPNSTLHVSSAAYLRQLAIAERAGLPIFTVDYALDPANMAAALSEARARGFVPFVAGRGLDTWIAPPP